jgi:hypothetical protein
MEEGSTVENGRPRRSGARAGERLGNLTTARESTDSATTDEDQSAAREKTNRFDWHLRTYWGNGPCPIPGIRFSRSIEKPQSREALTVASGSPRFSSNHECSQQCPATPFFSTRQVTDRWGVLSLHGPARPPIDMKIGLSLCCMLVRRGRRRSDYALDEVRPFLSLTGNARFEPIYVAPSLRVGRVVARDGV